jgi:alpha-tubulin suppressor-like RCC1 family protein
MGDALPIVPLSGFTSTLFAGPEHMCAWLNSNPTCWGNNAQGQLGLGDLKARGDNPGEMGNHLAPVNVVSNVLPDFAALGRDHTCVWIGGLVKCWGNNAKGQLGQDKFGASRTIVGDSPSEMGDSLPYTSLH